MIYPSPGFPIYESFIRYVNAIPVPLHLDESENFTFSPADLAHKITAKTKLIYINYPSNPTGGVASKSLLEETARIILERCQPDVRIYSDEIYDGITIRNSFSNIDEFNSCLNNIDSVDAIK